MCRGWAKRKKENTEHEVYLLLKKKWDFPISKKENTEKLPIFIFFKTIFSTPKKHKESFDVLTGMSFLASEAMHLTICHHSSSTAHAIQVRQASCSFLLIPNWDSFSPSAFMQEHGENYWVEKSSYRNYP